MKITRLQTLRKLPETLCLEPDVLLIYDRILLKAWGPWIRKFALSYAVDSGEGLKDLKSFPRHVMALMKIAGDHSPKKLRVIAFGGGSVGDFAGFFASVFKRGVKFEQIPSTWLAAIDSAHGGKTALNVGQVKNQVGTFYPATDVWLVEEVLTKLDRKKWEDALPEAIKVSLLDSESLSAKMAKVKNAAQLQKLLPEFIEAKMKVVRQDPEEAKGLRHLLNLGHTLGHVIETELGFSHGKSVGYGLKFALNWSAQRHQLDLRKLKSLLRFLPTDLELRKVLRSLRRTKTLLSKDKKSTQVGVRFIFLSSIARPVIEDLALNQVLAEVERQKGL